MPWIEGELIVADCGTRFAPGDLRLDRDPRHGDMGALVLRPHDGRVLDRHGVEVRAELHPDLPRAAPSFEEVADLVAQGVGAADTSIVRPVNAVSSGDTGATLILPKFRP